MRRKTTLCQAVLAMSISLALALPAFAQGTAQSDGMSSPRSTPPSGSASMKSSEQAGTAMQDKATSEADRNLNQHVRQALSGDTALAASAQKIHIETANGEVTLHGSVATETEKADIAAKVRLVAGVKKVNNQLQTASD
jgi:osmotically-inducible protein OsmY